MIVCTFLISVGFMCTGFKYLTKHNLKHSLSLISILISPLIELFSSLGNRKSNFTLFESRHGSSNDSSLRTF